MNPNEFASRVKRRIADRRTSNIKDLELRLREFLEMSNQSEAAGYPRLPAREKIEAILDRARARRDAAEGSQTLPE